MFDKVRIGKKANMLKVRKPLARSGKMAEKGQKGRAKAE